MNRSTRLGYVLSCDATPCLKTTKINPKITTAAFAHLTSVVLDGEAQLNLERLVREESVVALVLFVETAGVVLVRPANAHPTLVVEHAQQTLLFALDKVETVLQKQQKTKMKEKRQ